MRMLGGKIEFTAEGTATLGVESRGWPPGFGRFRRVIIALPPMLI